MMAVVVAKEKGWGVDGCLNRGMKLWNTVPQRIKSRSLCTAVAQSIRNAKNGDKKKIPEQVLVVYIQWHSSN